ncbi:MAG: hypothetical protein EAZ55_12040 [Cytophagales bacterium]|nr:MAG: hypothetical protein EAZ55_12040 [Cytophagales bacterium]
MHGKYATIKFLMKTKFTFFLLFFLTKTFILKAQEPPYNLYGRLNDETIRLHIADNQNLASESYYYNILNPKELIKIVPQFAPNNYQQIKDVWREERKGSTTGYFYITSPPTDVDIKGIWQSADKSQQFSFEFYHVLNVKGTINNRPIRMVLEYTGKEDEKGCYYRGYYNYLGFAQKFQVKARSNYAMLDQIVEEDNTGEFIAFFELSIIPQNNKQIGLWKSADGKQTYTCILEY